jgi:hypothetical protein
MTESPRGYHVTITVDQDGGHYPNPAEFAVSAQQAASARSASIVARTRPGRSSASSQFWPRSSPQP